MAFLRRWKALAPGDRRLVVEAACWFVLLRAALRVVPFAPLTRWTARRHRRRARVAAFERQRVGWATAAVARRLAPPESCLAQALTAQVMLGARGLPSTVRFGARSNSTRPFRAHAWLECDGEVLVGSEGLASLAEFRPLPRDSS